MKRCYTCGNEQLEESRFCSACGSDLSVTEQQGVIHDDSPVGSDVERSPRKVHKKKIVMIICAVIMVVAVILSLFFCLPSSKRQLRLIGLDAISELQYVVENDAYGDFIENMYSSFAVSELRKAICTDDYDEPIAVYSLEAPEFEELMEMAGDFDKELWENLPKKIKKELEKRYTPSSIITAINARNGSDAALLSSVYYAGKEYKRLNIREQKTYLYVFDEGTPVVVVFNPSDYVSAYLLLADCDFEDLSETREFFDKYEYEVKQVYSSH